MRLKAEHLRLELQKLALELGHELGPDQFRQAGDGFVAFSKGQRDWLQKNSEVRQHRSESLTVVAAAVAGIMAFAAAVSALKYEAVLAVVALLGVCTPALIAALKSWSEATLDRERAALHEKSRAALNDILGDQKTFDQAIDASDLAAASAYAERVFEVLRADHQGFAEGRKAAGAAAETGGGAG